MVYLMCNATGELFIRFTICDTAFEHQEGIAVRKFTLPGTNAAATWISTMIAVILIILQIYDRFRMCA